MSALIAKSLLKRIAADLAANPLARSEFRPIARMGGYYISLKPIFGDSRPMFSPEIDGQVCHIYYAPNQPTDATGH